MRTQACSALRPRVEHSPCRCARSVEDDTCGLARRRHPPAWRHTHTMTQPKPTPPHPRFRSLHCQHLLYSGSSSPCPQRSPHPEHSAMLRRAAQRLANSLAPLAENVAGPSCSNITVWEAARGISSSACTQRRLYPAATPVLPASAEGAGWVATREQPPPPAATRPLLTADRSRCLAPPCLRMLQQVPAWSGHTWWTG